MENWFEKRFKKLSKVPFNKEGVLEKNNETLVADLGKEYIIKHTIK